MTIKCNRQGDVLIVPIEGEIPADIPEAAREGGRVVLAHGEVTGHAHAIADAGATLYRDPAPKPHGALFSDPKLNALFLNTPQLNEAFMRVDAPNALLEHEEHTFHEISRGNKVVVRQREYNDNLTNLTPGEADIISRYVAD